MARTDLLSFSGGDFIPDVDETFAAGDNGTFPDKHVGKIVQVYDDTDESACITPQVELPDAAGATPTLKADVTGYFSSATTGVANMDIYVEAITPADAHDLEAVDDFGSANDFDMTAAATAGYLVTTTVTLTNDQSAAAGDWVRFGIRRKDTGGAASGHFYLGALVIYDDP